MYNFTSYAMQGITPFLWFEREAEDAAKFYVSIFKENSKIVNSTKLENTPSGDNTYIVELVLRGTHFLFINGGKTLGFTFSPATSFVIECKDQKEIDHYWKHLVDEGKPIQCGWLTDKYGVTWQVVPNILPRLLAGSNEKGRARTMQVMLSMVKLDIKKLEDAYAGR